MKAGENKLRSFSIRDGITTAKAFWSGANHQRKSKIPEEAPKGEDRTLERNVKKYDLQIKQQKDAEKKDKYKLYGELLQAYGLLP